jgi:hypothetical protein
MYEEFDAEILKNIRKGKTKNIQLVLNSRANMPPGVRDRYRAVDRRLQALRKSGAIRFDTKLGWSVIDH